MGPWRALSLPPASWPAPGPCGTPPSHYMPDFHRDQTNRICIASWGWVSTWPWFTRTLPNKMIGIRNARWFTPATCLAHVPFVFASFAELQKAAAVITALPWLPFLEHFPCHLHLHGVIHYDLMSVASLLSLPTNSRRRCSRSNSRTFRKLASRLYQR